MKDKNIDDLQETEVTDVQTTEELQDQIEQQDKDLDDAEKKKKKLKRKVKARNIVIVILTVIIILLLFRSCATKDNPNPFINRIMQFETNQEEEYNTEQTTAPHIDIPVIGTINVSKDKKQITLYNPDTNADKYYLQYELTVGNNTIYQSNLVKAGDKFKVNVYKLLDKGNYEGVFKVHAFKVDTMEEVNGLNNKLVINVE